MSEACIYIYICLGSVDAKHYIIKHSKELFDGCDAKHIEKWNATQYLVPLNQCITFDEFVDNIKLLAPCC